MKRFVRSVVFILLVSLLLSVPVFSLPSEKAEATETEYLHRFENSTVQISDDFSSLKVDGVSYVRFRSTYLREASYVGFTPSQVISSSASYDLSTASFSAACGGCVLNLYIEYLDGGNSTADFLLQTYEEEYNQALEGNYESFLVDFMWPEGNVVTGKASSLKQNEISLEATIVKNSYLYPVYCALNSDQSLCVSVGAVFEHKDRYYYSEAVQSVRDRWVYKTTSQEILAYEIVDEMIVSFLNDAKDMQLDEEFGIFLDEDFTTMVSGIFLVLLFGVIPLVLFVVFLAARFKSKKEVYRSLYGITAAISLASVLLFLILLGLIIL